MSEAVRCKCSACGHTFDAEPEPTHLLLCGDSTNPEDVARVMAGERAVLVHADGPYGMGKETDGIANDNLYRDKLDAFQLAWWKAARPHLADNATAYIWGNAEDLWRLWWIGGLRESERLTVINEIVWSKPGGFGVGTESQRSYFPNERCLVLMLGEQKMNNNADEFWEGWEPIRAALKADCDAMGWGPQDIDRICGVGMYSHWFTRSQWCFIPEEHYRKLQDAAREHDAFKREHDALKREWMSTRAFFDNQHDNMTDVWTFPRVVGEERFGHATPKPVELVERAIRSSCPAGGLVYTPFGGTGPELIAASRAGRRVAMVELSESYCDVARKRFTTFAREAGIEPGSGALE